MTTKYLASENAAKIRTLLDTREGYADLYRTIISGPSGQYADLLVGRILQNSARDLAKLIRGWANDRVVPSRYRREGVLIAAEWIDPDSTATPSNYEVPDAPAWPVTA